MHYLAIIVLIILLILILLNKERFIASYDMMINRSKNPTWTRYNGRDRDPWGRDYYDKFLGRQLTSEYMNFMT